MLISYLRLFLELAVVSEEQNHDALDKIQENIVTMNKIFSGIPKYLHKSAEYISIAKALKNTIDKLY